MSVVQLVVGTAAVVTLWLAVNRTCQVVRKPSELFFPVSGTLYKTPSETRRQYEPIFRRHSTSVITPEFLAALAQVEGSGNPVVRTYWRWSLTSAPFEVYRPASSDDRRASTVQYEKFAGDREVIEGLCATLLSGTTHRASVRKDLESIISHAIDEAQQPRHDGLLDRTLQATGYKKNLQARYARQ